MSARELHNEFRDANALDRDALVRQHFATILRALSLLAAVEESSADIDVSWLNILADEADADDSPGEARDFRSTAARIVALEAELASVKAHAEAMAKAAESLPENIEGWCEPLSDAVAAYRAAHPKEGT